MPKLRLKSAAALPALLSAAVIAGCASGGSSSATPAAGTAAPASPSMQQQAATGALPVSQIQWTGSFRTAAQISSDMSLSHTSVSGNVTLTALNDHIMRARINLSTNAGMMESTNLHWGLVPGDCHSGALPVAPLGTFPDITVSRDRGEIDTQVPIVLPTSGRYHVNVYRGDSTDESDVFTCTALTMGQIKR